MENKGGISVSGGGLKRKSSCPFGEGFYSKISKLLMSDEPTAAHQLQEIVSMVQKAKMEPSDEFWDSGDELSNDSMKIGGGPMQKKTQPDRMKIMKLDAVPVSEKERKKPVAPIKTTKPSDVPAMKKPDLIETLDDSDSEKDCFKCNQSTSSADNQLIACENCRTAYHAKCHQPEITSKQTADPRFIFLCASCNLHNLPKSRSASPKPSPSSSSRALDDRPKVTAKSTTDLSATFEAYKKKKERQKIRAGNNGLMKK